MFCGGVGVEEQGEQAGYARKQSGRIKKTVRSGLPAELAVGRPALIREQVHGRIRIEGPEKRSGAPKEDTLARNYELFSFQVRINDFTILDNKPEGKRSSHCKTSPRAKKKKG